MDKQETIKGRYTYIRIATVTRGIAERLINDGFVAERTIHDLATAHRAEEEGEASRRSLSHSPPCRSDLDSLYSATAPDHVYSSASTTSAFLSTTFIYLHLRHLYSLQLIYLVSRYHLIFILSHYHSSSFITLFV